MNGDLITHLINEATVGDNIQLKVICEKLNIQLIAAPTLKDYCHFSRNGADELVMRLNPKIDSKTRFTLVVIAVAEYLLQPSKIEGNGITYDMFSLEGLSHKKHTPYMMLATRLAMPEHIINALLDASDNVFEKQKSTDRKLTFNSQAYIDNAIYLPQFMRAIVKESSGKLVLESLKY